jgi:hypothetical protein
VLVWLLVLFFWYDWYQPFARSTHPSQGLAEGQAGRGGSPSRPAAVRITAIMECEKIDFAKTSQASDVAPAGCSI